MDAQTAAARGTSPSATPKLPALLALQLDVEFQAHTPADLERECRQLVQHTALTCIELGKRLCLLKRTVPHGDWLPLLARVGVEYRVAQRLMQVAIRFLSLPDGLRVVEAAKTKTKLFELLVLNDEELEGLALGQAVQGLTLDNLPTLTVAKLREQVRAEKQEWERKIADVGEFAGKDKNAAKTCDVARFETITQSVKCADVGTFGATELPIETSKTVDVDRFAEQNNSGFDARFEFNQPAKVADVGNFAPPADTSAKVAVDRNSERRKQYSRELCRVIARYADEDEVCQLTRALEDVAAWILARRPCPGLNDASYSVFNRFGRIGGAQ